MKQILKRSIILFVALIMFAMPVSASGMSTNRLEALSGQVVETAAADESTIQLPFNDVDPVRDSWFVKEVEAVYKAGILKGKTADTFAPYDQMVRAEYATVLFRLTTDDTYESAQFDNTFLDVPNGDWYTEPVLYCNAYGLMKGYGDGSTFGPLDVISREQAVTVLYRLAKNLNLNINYNENALDQFDDKALVNGYAQDAMKWAISNQIITGKYNGTKIDPASGITRAEIAIILVRFSRYYANLNTPV